jgi:hypothetical protein
MLGIWCQVWGGVIGRRSAWLKANGDIQRFETRDQTGPRAQCQSTSHRPFPILGASVAAATATVVRN